MLNLIHAENLQILEMLKTGLIAKEYRRDISFDAYAIEGTRIMKSLEKYSTCSECCYKDQVERMKNVLTETEDKK